MKYLHCTFQQFNTTNIDPKIAESLYAAKSMCELFAQDFIDAATGRMRSTGLVLAGRPGLGKTHLAVATLQSLVTDHNVKGLFVDISSLFHELLSTFDGGSDETRRSILRPVIDAECLVLDELGAQKSTDWVLDQLYLIINTRYNQQRPTIFTTNFRLGLEEAREAFEKRAGVRKRISGDFVDDRDKSELNAKEYLESRISEPLVSRLHEMAQIVHMRGDDFRKKVKQHSNRFSRRQ